jgi:hypothetical protein
MENATSARGNRMAGVFINYADKSFLVVIVRSGGGSDTRRANTRDRLVPHG